MKSYCSAVSVRRTLKNRTDPSIPASAAAMTITRRLVALLVKKCRICMGQITNLSCSRNVRLLFECPLHPLHSRRDHVTYARPHPQRRRPIVGGLALVDQNHPSSRPERQSYERRRRLHHERGAEDEHKVAAAGVVVGQHQLCLRQWVPEVHHRGDQPPATVGALRLTRHRLLGAVARAPTVPVPSYLLPGVDSVAAQAAHELPVAV